MKVVFYVVILLALLNAYGWFRNWQTESGPQEKLFQAGTVPNPKPNGFHERNMPGYTGAWQGKQFNSATSRGINIFTEKGEAVERYPFVTSVTKSLSEPNKDVFQINYDLAGNPFWLRRVVDEIVQNPDRTYTGKLHVQVLWMKFAVGWFALK